MASSGSRVESGRRPVVCSLVLDADDGVLGAECSCDHYVRNKLRRGPCEHVLALRIVAHRTLRPHARSEARPQAPAERGHA